MPYTGADPQRKIVLKSCDGVTFEVDETVATASQTIKDLIKDNCTITSVPLPNVTSEILEKVVKYCQRHVEAAAKASASKSEDADDLKVFDAEFVKVDQGTLIQLILAAHYLDIKSLTDVTCQAVADMIKGKTREEICRTFNITSDFTPEEEAELRREMPWAFE